MATLKGKWRFNDEITLPSDTITQRNLGFTIKASNLTGDGSTTTATVLMVTVGAGSIRMQIETTMYHMYTDDAWQTSSYGDDIQTITFNGETEVSDEFYTWFIENAVDVTPKKINGMWLFNEVLTAPPTTILLDSTASIMCEEGSVFYGIEVSPQCEMSYKYTDGEGFTAYDSTSGWAHEGYRRISFANEITVPDDFYAWFVANATPPSASVQYKGRTIANLFGDQSVVLKCKGTKMETDVIVKASGSQQVQTYKGEVEVV